MDTCSVERMKISPFHKITQTPKQKRQLKIRGDGDVAVCDDGECEVAVAVKPDDHAPTDQIRRILPDLRTSEGCSLS